ncbi:tetratricopeptide repeat protein [Schleiferilactobacillus harbinensis]|uniref:Tetratricopeptide repeat protein n=1 Tax=Schleiferilactobacillus harbinensis TaxID=304207 RepID=A0A5P8M4D2_9LACO|nr:tetratricopeptide repeat protein [Schleiferilactobacillus harbinensis]
MLRKERDFVAEDSVPAPTAKDRIAARVHTLVAQIDRDPRDKKAMIELAHLLVTQNDLDQASTLLTKALGLFPDDDLLQYNLAVVATAQGQYSIAQKLLAQVTDPVLAADKAYTTGQIYYKQQQYPRALAFALTAVDHNGADAQYQLLYGDILSALENWTLAVPALQQAASLAPKGFKPHFDLGVALLGQGQVDEARAVLAQAEKIDPARFQHQLTLFSDIGRLMQRQKGAADHGSDPQ